MKVLGGVHGKRTSNIDLLVPQQVEDASTAFARESTEFHNLLS